MKNKKIHSSYFLLCTLFFLMSFPAFSQEVIGKVRDKRTGDTIPNVKVYWKNDPSDSRTTNKDGIYRIKTNSNDKILIFEFPGKVNVSVPIAEIRKKFFEYDVDMENVGMTSTTASHWEQSVYEIPASTIILSRDDIERNGYLSLQEILENVPGFFTIDHRSESDVTIGVRGFWAPFNRNVMIQVNGVNMLSERQNDFPLNKINIPVEAIERIEIVRGPLSVIYGAGAFFGVINIITSNQLGNAANSQVSIGLGSQNSHKQFARYSINKNGFVMSMNIMNSTRDGFVQPWDSMISPSNYALYANQYSSSAPYDTMTADAYQNQLVNKERYSKSNQSINMSIAYQDFSANMNFARSDFGFSFIHPGPSQRNSYISNTINTQLKYAKTGLSNRFNYELKLAHFFSQVDASYKYFLEESYTPGEDLVASIRTEANAQYKLVENDGDSTWGMQLSGGIAYTSNYQNSSTYNAAEFNLRNWYIGLTPNTNLETMAMYAQTDIQLKNLQIVAAGRMERQGAYEMLSIYNQDYQFPYTYVDANGVTIYDTVFLEPTSVQDTNKVNAGINYIPRLAMIYKFGEREDRANYLRLTYGSAIKQASVVDNASDVMLTYSGNNKPYLLPEKIRTLELGYTFKFDLENYKIKSKKLLILNANLFRNDLLQLVTRRTDIVGGEYITRSRNSGEQVTNGIELISTIEYKFPREKKKKDDSKKCAVIFASNANITYQKTVNIDTLGNKNDFVSFSPNLLGGANFSLTLSDFKDKKPQYLGNMIFTVGFNYVGSMKAYYETDSTNSDFGVLPPRFIGEETNDYFRWSANVRFNNIRLFREETGGFYFNCKVDNLFNSKYRYPTYTINPWADKGIAGRPRQVLFTLGYKF